MRRKSDTQMYVLIAATNRSLENDVREGRFREDLFFRLNVIPLTIPPLHERPEDLLLQARHYLHFFERRQGRQNLAFSPACEQTIRNHSWPGNMRELRNAVERAVILCPASIIEQVDMGLVSNQRTTSSNGESMLGSEITLEEIEREHIARVVARSPSFEAAARTLGIDITTLQRKRQKYGIS
ncbi:MAG TPA: helix-turn-helix domain-containing protein [Pirellulaceae bacterium]|nr:helix-turn-helix domain-containing protein [Pirellulaceae bacterium]